MIFITSLLGLAWGLGLIHSLQENLGDGVCPRHLPHLIPRMRMLGLRAKTLSREGSIFSILTPKSGISPA